MKRYLLPLLLTLLLVTGCETIRIQHGESSYTRASLLSDKQISDVKLRRTKDGVLKAEVGKANTEIRAEALELLRGLLTGPGG